MSKRQLRSDTAAGANAPPALYDLPEPTAVKKQRKSQPIRYPCYACDEEKTAGRFPDYNPSSECEHLINTCKDCLKQWVQAQIEQNIFIKGDEDGKTLGIKCPQCDAMMRNVNIKLATTKKWHDLFEERERHYFAEITPGWRWCLAPGCRAGQVHQKKGEIKIEADDKENASPKSKGKKKGKSKQTKKKQDENLSVQDEKLSAQEIEAKADICICNECGAKACVTCDRPWHEGETCEAYQARIKDRVEEEDKSIEAISRISRKCPNCQKNIQKNGGCPAMHCSGCGVGFCWNCMTVWQSGPYGMCKCQQGRPPAPQ